jgi:hypothetical protein
MMHAVGISGRSCDVQRATLVQRWIVAALRKRKFFSLAEVNQAIAELLVRVNRWVGCEKAGSARERLNYLFWAKLG